MRAARGRRTPRRVGVVARAVSVGAPLAALVLFTRASASAPETAKAPRTSSLSWVRLPGAEQCVPTQALARGVEDRLGRSVFVSAARADVSVEGRIEPRHGGGFRAVITLRDAGGALLGTRELVRGDASCEALTEPLALVIAVMIDPDAALAPKGPSDAGPPDATPVANATEDAGVDAAPPPPAPTAEPPPPSKPPAAPWSFEGSAGFVGSVGLLPKVGLGVGANALLTPPHFVTLEGFGAIYLDDTASAENGAYSTFNLAYVGSGLCPLALQGDVVRFFGCFESHLGLVRNRQSGFVSTASGDDFRALVDSALELRVTVRFAGPFALRAGLAGVLPWIRYDYRYTRADGSSDRVFRMAPVAGVADLGLGLAIP